MKLYNWDIALKHHKISQFLPIWSKIFLLSPAINRDCHQYVEEAFSFQKSGESLLGTFRRGGTEGQCPPRRKILHSLPPYRAIDMEIWIINNALWPPKRLWQGQALPLQDISSSYMLASSYSNILENLFPLSIKFVLKRNSFISSKGSQWRVLSLIIWN